MVNWYRELKLEFQVALWSMIVILGLFVTLIPLYFFKLMEIPQGIVLGGLVAILVYLFLGLFDKREEPMKSIVITVIILIIKFLIIAGLLFLVGWLYYGKGFKQFNIFAVAGGYFIPLIINIILVRKEKESGYSSKL